MGGKEDDEHHFFNRRNHYDLNSKIMLTAIITLSVVVFLVLLLHMYARFVLRRRAQQRALMRGLGLTVNRSHSGEPPVAGLDPTVIAALPIFVFQRANGQDEASATECAVCLSMLENEDAARLLPNCKHTFHAECIDKWLSSHSTCPICRTEAEPRLMPEPREAPVGPAPTAPPLERVNSGLCCMEGTSESSAKVNGSGSGSGSRLSSFRRMVSRERSSRRIQACVQGDGVEDLERQ